MSETRNQKRNFFVKVLCNPVNAIPNPNLTYGAFGLFSFLLFVGYQKFHHQEKTEFCIHYSLKKKLKLVKQHRGHVFLLSQRPHAKTHLIWMKMSLKKHHRSKSTQPFTAFLASKAVKAIYSGVLFHYI